MGIRHLPLVVLLIVGSLALGPATTYARRAADGRPYRGSVHSGRRRASDAGLVAAWGFGGGIAGTDAMIADASGRGNTLTLVNSTLMRHGKYGGGVRFTGRDSLATAPATRSLDLRSRMTLEAWVRPSKLAAGYATIMAKTRTGGGFPYGLELTDGRPDAYGVIGGRVIKVRAKARLPKDRWSFLAATYDGFALRLYIGDRLAAKVAITGTFRRSAGPLQIGGDQVWGEFFTGSVDNVRIFSKARSTMQLGHDRLTPVRGGLVHGPVSTTGGPGGTTAGSGGTGLPGEGGFDTVGQGASAGIGVPPPPGPAVYVGQSTAGDGDGSSCANAHSADWFNSATDWGNGVGQIGPGDVVHLCGRFRRI